MTKIIDYQGHEFIDGICKLCYIRYITWIIGTWANKYDYDCPKSFKNLVREAVEKSNEERGISKTLEG